MLEPSQSCDAAQDGDAQPGEVCRGAGPRHPHDAGHPTQLLDPVDPAKPVVNRRGLRQGQGREGPGHRQGLRTPGRGPRTYRL